MGAKSPTKGRADGSGYRKESHWLLPIDPNDILATLLPVIYPRPVSYGRNLNKSGDKKCPE